MAKYVFLNMPAAGHVNPTLPIAQELVQRGQEVSYYLTEEFRGAVQETGATFHPYTSKIQGQLNFDTASSGPGQFPLAKMGAMMSEEANFVPPQIIDTLRAEKPDVIIYDFLCIWAPDTIEKLQVPAISTRGTYASNEHFDLFAHVRKTMAPNPVMRVLFEGMSKGAAVLPGLARFPGMFSRVESLNIIFIPREFQPEGESFDERFLFVGPSILPRYQATAFPFEQLKEGQPLLYISLGSMMSNQLAFYRMCFEAFKGSSWQVVLSVGKHTDLSQLGPVPDNFIISPYVPQLEILPRAQVFVTHAGTNSVMESMYYGVPMVLIPQQPEQLLHAQRTQALGAGLMVDKATLTMSQLRDTVEQVAQEKSYRERAQYMQDVVRAAGGHQRAAEAIMKFVETQHK